MSLTPEQAADLWEHNMRNDLVKMLTDCETPETDELLYLDAHDPMAYHKVMTSHGILERRARALEEALRQAHRGLRNDFEPDNQSALYCRLEKFLAALDEQSKPR